MSNTYDIFTESIVPKSYKKKPFSRIPPHGYAKQYEDIPMASYISNINRLSTDDKIYAACQNFDYNISQIDHDIYVLNEQPEKHQVNQLCQNFQVIIKNYQEQKIKNIYIRYMFEYMSLLNIEEQIANIIETNIYDYDLPEVLIKLEIKYHIFKNIIEYELYEKNDIKTALRFMAIECTIREYHDFEIQKYNHDNSKNIMYSLMDSISKLEYILPNRLKDLPTEEMSSILTDYNKMKIILEMQSGTHPSYEKILNLITDKWKALDDISSTVISIEYNDLLISCIKSTIRKACLPIGLLVLQHEDKQTKEDLSETFISLITQFNHSKKVALVNICSSEIDKLTILQSLIDITRIESYSRNIQNNLRLNEIKQKNIGYYTSIENFEKMLPRNNQDKKNSCSRFMIMNMEYMNDPNEGKTLINQLADNNIEKLISKDRALDNEYIFMKCFTTRIDDLPMWEMYGNRSEGCCIIADLSADSPFFSIYNENIYRICYINPKNTNTKNFVYQKDNEDLSPESRSEIDRNIRLIRSLIRTHQKESDFISMIYEALGITRYLFKDSVYSHENEIRILRCENADSDKIITLDTNPPKLCIKSENPLYITKVILGPKLKNAPDYVPYLQHQLDNLCETEHITPEANICYSSIDFR